MHAERKEMEITHMPIYLGSHYNHTSLTGENRSYKKLQLQLPLQLGRRFETVESVKDAKMKVKQERVEVWFAGTFC
ncbi:hypothetical protein GOBAR_DD27980 [Gossypium barbadense]|nr:hypothetical protein GOBAR_DD27980 [Gossypium barbadense]